MLCPVDAPVRIFTLNSRPAACSASAIVASSRVVAFGAPAGVKPDRPSVSPFLISCAASEAVSLV